tara:strand:- start:1404 stop:1685 length:282 start_codon:yes stop_codon:yes gene_type:complete
MQIEYDLDKAESNVRKHGISFEEAASALFDANALVREDIDSINESRWILLGMSEQGRLLTVVYTLKSLASLKEESIRIISARKASRRELRQYA